MTRRRPRNWDWDRCLYCWASYPPGTRSREHVLPDAFGARLRLPSGAVCVTCNNRLNLHIDQPLRLIFQPLLSWFGIAGEKRGRPATARVQATTALGVIQARLGKGGKLTLPGAARVRRDAAQDGNAGHALEWWQFSSRNEMDRLLVARRAEHAHLAVAQEVEVPIRAVTAKVSGNTEMLSRAVARAGLNYLAHRRPADAIHGDLEHGRKHVLTGAGDLPLKGPPEILAAAVPHAIEDLGLRPQHHLSVGTDGDGILRCVLVLFGELWFEVTLSESWEGEAYHAEEEFDAVERTNGPVDRAFIHPGRFKVVTPGQLGLIRPGTVRIVSPYGTRR